MEDSLLPGWSDWNGQTRLHRFHFGTRRPRGGHCARWISRGGGVNLTVSGSFDRTRQKKTRHGGRGRGWTRAEWAGKARLRLHCKSNHRQYPTRSKKEDKHGNSAHPIERNRVVNRPSPPRGNPLTTLVTVPAAVSGYSIHPDIKAPAPLSPSLSSYSIHLHSPLREDPSRTWVPPPRTRLQPEENGKAPTYHSTQAQSWAQSHPWAICHHDAWPSFVVCPSHPWDALSKCLSSTLAKRSTHSIHKTLTTLCWVVSDPLRVEAVVSNWEITSHDAASTGYKAFNVQPIYS